MAVPVACSGAAQGAAASDAGRRRGLRECHPGLPGAGEIARSLSVSRDSGIQSIVSEKPCAWCICVGWRGRAGGGREDARGAVPARATGEPWTDMVVEHD